MYNCEDEIWYCYLEKYIKMFKQASKSAEEQDRRAAGDLAPDFLSDAHIAMLVKVVTHMSSLVANAEGHGLKANTVDTNYYAEGCREAVAKAFQVMDGGVTLSGPSYNTENAKGKSTPNKGTNYLKKYPTSLRL